MCRGKAPLAPAATARRARCPQVPLLRLRDAVPDLQVDAGGLHQGDGGRRPLAHLLDRLLAPQHPRLRAGAWHVAWAGRWGSPPGPARVASGGCGRRRDVAAVWGRSGSAIPGPAGLCARRAAVGLRVQGHPLLLRGQARDHPLPHQPGVQRRRPHRLAAPSPLQQGLGPHGQHDPPNPAGWGRGVRRVVVSPLPQWAKNLERYDKRMEEFLANNQFNKSAVKQIEGVKP